MFMSKKAKGSRAERELFHKLWLHFGPCVRAAGSGSTTKPAPDLITSDGSRVIAIECKSVKGTKKYFEHEEIEQLVSFATGFGAEPWIAVRFDNKGWYFLEATNLSQSKGKSLLVSFELAQKNGKKFEEFLGMYQQQRLV
jgi:holliday junction resolvase Hjr